MMAKNQAQIKTLKDERQAISDAVTELVETAEKVRKDGTVETGKGSVYLTDSLSGQQLEEWDRLATEWDRLNNAIEILEFEDQREATVAIQDDVYGNYRERQVQTNVKALEDLFKVGQNQYLNPNWRDVQGSRPRELHFHQPAIIRDRKTGLNRVWPIPAVWDVNGQMSIEASFRWAEIVRSGKFAEYDPTTGNRVELAASTDPVTSSDVPNSIPDLVTDLYEYMFYISEMAQLCMLYQTPGLQPLPIERRTDVPAAKLVAESAAFADSQPAYSEVTLDTYKYGFIAQYSYEASRQIQGWQFADKLIQDGGIAFGQTIDELLLTGDGTNKPRGLLTAIKADSNQQVSGIKLANIFGTGWGADDLVGIATNLPQPYDRMMSARVITRKATWVKAMSMVDSDGQLLLIDGGRMITEQNIFGLIQILLNDHVDNFAKANNYPFITAALETMALRMAGPMRVDFSGEYGFANDLLSYRFAQHWDCDQINPNGARGYKLKA